MAAFTGEPEEGLGPFWPDDVPHVVNTPRFMTLYDRLVTRGLRRDPHAVVLSASQVETDYETFDLMSTVAARALHGLAGSSTPRVALVLERALDLATTLLGAVRSGATVLIADPHSPVRETARLLELFAPDVVVADGDAGTGHHTVPIQTLADIDPGRADWKKPSPSRPAVALAWGDGIVYHSETSLLSGARALSEYFMLTANSRVAVARSASSWEWLWAALAVVEAEGSILAIHFQDDPIADLEAARPDVLWLDASTALGLLSDDVGIIDTVRQSCSLLLVSVEEPLPVRLRRRLQRAVGCPVLTTLGSPATGIIAASATQWTLDEAVGTPITGISVHALDPIANTVIEPRWDLLTYAGIGVSGQAVALSADGTTPGGFVSDDILNVGVPGRLDANGLLYLVS